MVMAISGRSARACAAEVDARSNPTTATARFIPPPRCASGTRLRRRISATGAAGSLMRIKTEHRADEAAGALRAEYRPVGAMQQLVPMLAVRAPVEVVRSATRSDPQIDR